MKTKVCYLILTALLVLTLVPLIHAESLRGKTVSICDDGAEWPPYTYYKRVDGKKTEKIVGFSVDVIKEIFDNNSISFTLILLPWKRCQYGVEQGDKYQMFLSGIYSKERAERYYLSRGYYVTTPYYFYSRKNNPKGLAIQDKADLKNYRVCGLLGYSYADFGLSDDETDSGTKTYDQLIPKLHKNRCDLFVERLEIMAGFSVIGKDYLSDTDLAYAPVPGMKPVSFYMMFTKNELGKELQRIVDEGIVKLEKSGRLQDILKKYVPK